jgi:hypothetical protein
MSRLCSREKGCQVISAEAKLLTYEQAGKRIPTTNGKGRSAKFIQRRVASGELVGTQLGHRSRYVSEFDLNKWLQESRTTEKRRMRK